MFIVVNRYFFFLKMNADERSLDSPKLDKYFTNNKTKAAFAIIFRESNCVISGVNRERELQNFFFVAIISYATVRLSLDHTNSEQRVACNAV